MPALDSTSDPTNDSADSTTAQRLALLSTSDLVIEGRMPWSSNATFLCELWPTGKRPDGGLTTADDDQILEDDGDVYDDDQDEDEDNEANDVEDDGNGAPTGRLPGTGGPLGRAIYKPYRGERPLWDFPDGLYRREAGAFQLAQAIGWDCIPPTIVRDGPFGSGSVQWFIDADFDQHHFTLVEDEGYHPQLRRMCAFDIVANSTDRKGGHILVDADHHLWGIDNGLCLHAEFKLRTVIWEFATEHIPAEMADDLARFASAPLPATLCDILDPFERDGLLQRARALVAAGRFPIDPTGRRYPWPLV